MHQHSHHRRAAPIFSELGSFCIGSKCVCDARSVPWIALSKSSGHQGLLDEIALTQNKTIALFADVNSQKDEHILAGIFLGLGESLLGQLINEFLNLVCIRPKKKTVINEADHSHSMSKEHTLF